MQRRTYNGTSFRHKGNEILLFAATLVNPEGTVLSGISHRESGTIRSHSYVKYKKTNEEKATYSTDTESQICGC